MTEPIDIQLKKGVLELCVLELLSQEDGYAYEIASRLADAIGMGEGTVYPLMRRLHTEGLVETYLVESSTGNQEPFFFTAATISSLSTLSTRGSFAPWITSSGFLMFFA